MSQISTEIGKQIRTFRKKRKMTLEALAAVICKSKSTVSKYENGEIPHFSSVLRWTDTRNSLLSKALLQG